MWDTTSSTPVFGSVLAVEKDEDEEEDEVDGEESLNSERAEQQVLSLFFGRKRDGGVGCRTVCSWSLL